MYSVLKRYSSILRWIQNYCQMIKKKTSTASPTEYFQTLKPIGQSLQMTEKKKQGAACSSAYHLVRWGNRLRNFATKRMRANVVDMINSWWAVTRTSPMVHLFLVRTGRRSQLLSTVLFLSLII